ncbi:MAG: CRP-like cAMP-binding protein [Roseivirga sp.]|jgi:CRP-like cAMP-binding protein
MELFQYLETQSSIDLSGFINEVHIQKGSHVYIPGQSTNFVYEIVTGAIKLGSYGSQGQEVTYDVISNPDTFGNLKYLNGQFFEFSESLVPTKLRTYHLDFFKKIIVEDPIVSEWFNKNIIRRWSKTETRLFHVRSLDKIEKVEAVFKEFDYDIFDDLGRKHNLFSLLTMQDLGDLTGMTRQTVSQILKGTRAKKRRKVA